MASAEQIGKNIKDTLKAIVGAAILMMVLDGVFHFGKLSQQLMTLAALIAVLVYIWRRKAPEPPQDEYISGSDFKNPEEIAEKTDDKSGTQIKFGEVPLPRDFEPLGVAVVGSPGGGKSQAINGNLSTLRKRGERVFMLDAGGEALAAYYREGDIILNAYDDRCMPWSPMAEVQGVWDCAAVAFAIVGPDDTAEGFKDYATQLIAAVMERLIERGETTNKNLLYWCTTAKRKELAKLVSGMPISRLFEEGNDRYLGTVLGIIGQALGPMRYLDPAAGMHSFSLRKWCADANADNWIWFPYREDQSNALLPLMHTLVEVTATSLLAQETALGRRVWFVMDEFASVGRCEKILDLLTKGRKKGAAAIIGFQSIAQLDKIYGIEGRNIIKNCLQTLVAFAASDTATAQWLEETIGKTKFIRHTTTTSTGQSVNEAGGVTESTSKAEGKEHVEESLILASMFEQLPPLKAVLKIKGMPVTVVKVAVATPDNPSGSQPPCFIPKKAAVLQLPAADDSEDGDLVGYTVSREINGESETQTFKTQGEAEAWKAETV